MAYRVGPPLQETASTSYPVHRQPACRREIGRALAACGIHRAGSRRAHKQWRVKLMATAQDERMPSAPPGTADAPGSAEVIEQLPDRSGDEYFYLPMSEYQALIGPDEDLTVAAPPKLLTFCKTGEEELRLVNYAINGTLVGLSVFLSASQLGTPVVGPSVVSALKDLSQQGWSLYQHFVDAHPILTKAAISGTVYGLGDLTAQTYEGRSWREFDALRVLRSGLCGFLVHGPLSHVFYEKLDRAIILSKYFQGGDAWYTPLAKIAIDQTVFATTWNSIYYLMLGGMKRESPGVILESVRESWWELLKAGWRVWPVVHLVTYTLIPCQHRLLWVDMVELTWVTVLCIYGQQRRERMGLAACALPGVAGEGGAFTEDILRGMAVQNQITFQRGDEEPVVKRFEEVYVDAAVLEANAANSVDMINRYAHSVGDAREERE